MKNRYLILLIFWTTFGCANISNIKNDRVLEIETPTFSTPLIQTPNEDCNALQFIDNADASIEFKESNLVYIGDNPNEDQYNDQIWKISMKDGVEKIIYDNVSYKFSAIGFLPDKYHFLLVGQQNSMLSDLDGSPLVDITDTAIYISDFERYSPVWNALTKENEKNYYDRNGNGFLLYSRDNKYVAQWGPFFSIKDDSGKYFLTIQNRETKEDTKVFSSASGEVIQGGWSPNGEKFVFTWYKNIPAYYSNIYIVNSDGTGLRNLVENLEGETVERPLWSPSGSKVAFPTWGRDGNIYFIVIDLTTNSTSRFKAGRSISLNSRMDQGELAWSPDENWLAYVSKHDHYGLQILNTSTGERYCGNNEEQLNINIIIWR